MEKELYNLPLYYDIAFSWDAAVEIELFREYFTRYVPFEVKNILEPACGSGRFLVSLPKYGFRVTGYDNNPKMVEFARERILRAGLQASASVALDDMRSARFSMAFDSAITPINSLGYLLTDEDVVAHFENTGACLKRGGIYIIQVNCACDSFEPPADKEVGDDWVYERDCIRVKTRWMIENEDTATKLSHQLCKMEIDDHGDTFTVEDRHVMRLWLFDDLVDLIQRSGKFKLAAIYDNKNKEIPRDAHISGELGNLYCILKAIER